jgi:hypothetical protein
MIGTQRAKKGRAGMASSPLAREMCLPYVEFYRSVVPPSTQGFPLLTG